VTPLAIALAGAAAGVGGALVLVPFVWLSRVALGGRRSDRERNPLAPGTILSETATQPPDLLQVTGVFVQKVATGIFGASLSVKQQRRYGALWHLAYGAAWGVGFALIATSIDVPALVLGPLYGLLVWAIGPAWLVPQMRLMLPVGRASRRATALVVAWHVGYGFVVAAVFTAIHG
jgi:hypothetical protein